MKDKLEKKLVELAKQKEQIVAQLNAVMGAEQVIQAMLEEENKNGNE